MARIYATRGDLVDYAPDGVTVPDEPEVTRLLTRASERVDLVLKTAVYDVDDDGMPTDTCVIEALKLATCAQALWWVQSGDESGVASQYGDFTAGRITLRRSQSTAGTANSGVLNAAALVHLSLAGLIPGFIYSP